MTFEKDFPSLKDKILMNVIEIPVIRTVELLNSCLDKEKFKELDEIFYSVPQPCRLEKKWEAKKKELGI